MYIQIDILECRLMHIQMYIHYRIKYDTNLDVKTPSAFSVYLNDVTNINLISSIFI